MMEKHLTTQNSVMQPDSHWPAMEKEKPNSWLTTFIEGCQHSSYHLCGTVLIPSTSGSSSTRSLARPSPYHTCHLSERGEDILQHIRGVASTSSMLSLSIRLRVIYPPLQDTILKFFHQFASLLYWSLGEQSCQIGGNSASQWLE